MKRSRLSFLIGAASSLLFCGFASAQDAPTSFKFSFAPGAAPAGFTQVAPDATYTKTSGFGFDLGSKPQPAAAGVTGAKPFYFSVAVPEGNYKVTVVLGDPSAESTTTVKAEQRRLMLERIHTDAGKTETRSFTVNIRTPKISTGGEVGIDPGEVGALDWDEKLTLEFSDAHPALDSMEIDKIDCPTIYVLGDSTVTDQAREPGGSWAQSLPRWFTSQVAVANHAESGETLRAFRRPAERRWDKVLSLLKPGDYVFMQFGTNDSKNHGPNNIYADEDFSQTYAEANTLYKSLLVQYAAETKAKGAIPVIVSPMGRRNMQNGKSTGAIGEYPKAAGDAAKEANCPFIDLSALSIQFYEALGPDLVGKAFNDGTHPNSYGGYMLSRCIVEGIKADKLDLANYLVDDAGTFDPSHPVPMPADFKLPPDPSTPRAGGRARGATRPAPAAN